MNIRLLKLRRRQIDENLTHKTNIKDIKTPERGWINEIRISLGMTYGQLAKRLNISASAVKYFEKSEKEGKIKIETLKKTAEAMNCKLVYAIVPEQSLEKIYEAQVMNAAKSIFNKVSHTMDIEKQGILEEESKKQLMDLYDEIKSTMNRKIWDYEI